MLISYNVKLNEKMNMHLNEHAFTHTLFVKHAFIYTDCFYFFLSLRRRQRLDVKSHKFSLFFQLSFICTLQCYIKSFIIIKSLLHILVQTGHSFSNLSHISRRSDVTLKTINMYMSGVTLVLDLLILSSLTQVQCHQSMRHCD